MNEHNVEAMKELMEILKDGMNEAFSQGYVAGFEHRTRMEASRLLKTYMDSEGVI